MYLRFLGALLLTVFIASACSAQYSSKRIKSKYESYTDSLKNVEYDYIFPVLGQQVYSRGFDIPYPVGLMGNYIWLKQNINIENMRLGLLTDDIDLPLTEVDFLEFGENTNTSYSVNFRPDVWVFPFLNVYGIFGYGSSETEINLIAPLSINSVVRQSLTTAGFGVLGAFGIGPVWVSVDANFTWNKPELLEEAVNTNVLGIRFGHTFVFKQRPERNIAIWLGASRVGLASETVGEIKLIDALPPDVWERRDEFVNDYNAWYNSLDPTNPQDRIKIKAADEVLTPIVERIDAADGESIVRYGMDKAVEDLWNGVVGAQFQLNKRWMARSEVGLIGNRKSYLLSLNYRFLL